MLERNWISVERTPRALRKQTNGRRPHKAFIKEISTQEPKPLVISQWTDITVIDKTLYTKRVHPSLNSKFEIVPKCETYIFKEPVSTDTSVQTNIPWQYSQEGGEPYEVQFSTEDTYYSTREFEPDIIEEIELFTTTTDTPHTTGAVPKQWDPTLFLTRRGTGILKKRIIPLSEVPDTTTPNTYKHYKNWYIRGIARRNRYRKRILREYNQKNRRSTTFTYLLNQNYYSTISTENYHFHKIPACLPTINLANLVSTRTRYTTETDTDTYFN
jgi:hypothetical protein